MEKLIIEEGGGGEGSNGFLKEQTKLAIREMRV